MALCEGGTVVGSVSGDCVEDALIFRFTWAYAARNAAGDAGAALQHQIPSGPPSFVRYGISADEAHR